MGLYINPTDVTKEEWLENNAKAITHDDLVDKILGSEVDFKTQFPVCLMDNGPFKAAGVGHSKQEIEYFMQDDGRIKQYFIVSRDDLLTVCPEAKGYIGELK